MKKIGVFTSGGDSPGMNAAIRAVVRTAMHYGLEVSGIKLGYQGMIEGKITEMNARSVGNIIHRGGTILHSSRSEEFRSKAGREKAYKQIVKFKIDGLVAIGGNGTFAGARELYKEFGIPIVGLPGTIDNDLYGTDFTIGFDTALNTVVQAIDKIRDTAESHNRIFFVEVMGRDTGFIALHSGVACGAESILIPEIQDDLLILFKTLNKSRKMGKASLIVIVAEGDEEGGAFEISKRVREEFEELECRVVVLGHLQRGGPPSYRDRFMATILGVSAVEALIRGQKDVMAGLNHEEVVLTPFEETIEKKHAINERLFKIVEMMAI